ncbi:hypothetical protein SAMN05216311_11256 [Chitinophaga sp. CF418]|nr:hypothetical protein SAMN05216311_11256 [Chitinophaga sp. CF418]
MELRAKVSYERCKGNGRFIYFDGLFYDFGQNSIFAIRPDFDKSR